MPRSTVSIADLLEAKSLKAGEKLRMARRNGDDFVAEVLEDGRLRAEGQDFRSPTAAANALRGSNNNGWTAWRVDRGGRMVSLAEIRRSTQS